MPPHPLRLTNTRAISWQGFVYALSFIVGAGHTGMSSGFLVRNVLACVSRCMHTRLLWSSSGVDHLHVCVDRTRVGLQLARCGGFVCCPTCQESSV